LTGQEDEATPEEGFRTEKGDDGDDESCIGQAGYVFVRCLIIRTSVTKEVPEAIAHLLVEGVVHQQSMVL
jgi:hypothetical protein